MMLKKITAATLIALPNASFALDFNTESQISEVTVFAAAARLTRDVTLDLPAGEHRISVSLPNGLAENTLRVLPEEGLRIGAISSRNTRLPPDEREIAARQEIEDQIEAIEDQISEKENTIAEINLIIDAANTRIILLRGVGNQQANGATGADGKSSQELSDLVTMVGDQTLLALQDAQLARLDIAAINDEINDLRLEIKTLNERLAAVSLPLTDRLVMSMTVMVSDGYDGDFQLRYLTGAASWAPNYEFSLNSETAELTIDRQVTLTQYTGETWENAAISVTTSQPSGALSHGHLRGSKASYFVPAPPAPVAMEDSSAGALTYVAPTATMIEEPSRMGGRESFETNGLSAQFTLPAGSVLDGDGVETTVSVDKTVFETELSARGTAYNDETAYLYASFENNSALPYLPGPAVFYRDDAFIGEEYEIPSIGIGEVFDRGFGEIEGLKIQRNTLSRETGEAGVLTTRNDSIDEYEIVVENLTHRDWDMIIYDRVPYSEQEDLEIDYSALPRPAETNVDGQRGVLAWHFNLPVAETYNMVLEYEMEWPAGTELRR